MGITKASEVYFPRGGEADDGSVFKKKAFVFEKKTKNKKRRLGRCERNKRRKSKEQNELKPAFKSRKEILEPLIYLNLCPGMKMMCSVRNVANDHIIIGLPKRLCGRINVEKISQPYSSLLNQAFNEGSSSEQRPKLQAIFQKGQILYCKVVDIINDPGSDKNNLVLSLDPADVNSDITQDLVTEGDILITAVSSIEDHGYKMYTGVTGVVGYLSQEDSNSYIEERNRGKPLAVGQILWCKVKKCTGLGPCKTIQVTINVEDISCSFVKENITLDKLNPGNSVDVTVVKVTPVGLHVRIPDTDIVGYIETGQLPFPWSKPSDYSFGNILKACVLLKLPHIGNIYFSCRINPTTISRPEIVPGTIFKDAVVHSVTGGNIIVQLKHGDSEYKGFVSYKNIGEELEKNEVQKKFNPGSTVICRVMAYEFMEEIYICSMKKNEIEQKYLTHFDVKPGDLVDVVISSYMNKVCIVTFDNLTGTVLFPHMSDVPLDKPELKFQLNSSHKGRVLYVNPGKKQIFITLKPTLVSNPPLLSLDNLQVNDYYYGAISDITPDGIEVSFYGNVKTKIYFTYLPDKLSNYSKYEVVKCYISKIVAEKPYFSLVKTDIKPSTSFPLEELVVGKRYPLEVISTSNSTIDCKLVIRRTEYLVKLPVEHLSDHLSLCGSLLKFYSPGTKIFGAVLYAINNKKLIFTLRKSVKQFFKDHKGLNGFESLEIGSMIPCTIENINSNGAKLIVPIPGFNKTIFVPKKDLCDEDQIPFEINQGLLAKFVGKENNEYKLICTMKKLSVNVKWITDNLLSYRKEASLLQKMKTGMKVTAVVTKVLDHLVTFDLHSGATALMQRKSESVPYTVGEKLDATVIFQDPVFGTVHLMCEKETKIKQMERTSNSLSTGTIVSGTIVYGNTQFLVAVLNKGTMKGYLIHIPVHLHPNSTSHLSVHDVGFMTSHDIIISSVHKGIAIGFLKKQNIFECEENSNMEVTNDEDLKIVESNEESESRENSVLESSPGMEKRKKNQDQNEPTKKIKRDSTSSTKLREDNSGSKQNICKVPKEECEENSNEEVTNDEDLEIVESIGGRQKSESKENSVVESSTDKKKRKNNKNENEPTKKIKSDSTSSTELREDNSAAKQNKFISPMDFQMKLQPDLSKFSLSDAASFVWNATPDDLSRVTSGIEIKDEIKEEECDDEVTVKRKLTPAEKRIAAQEKERKIREKEEELLSIEHDPKSVDHFERLVLGSPNSSIYWVKYMAFHLQATEIEKARVIAKRALKQMNIREEKERMNIWVALLNLENLYGTAESFKEVLDEALKLSDDYQINLKVLEIYAGSDKIRELEQLTNMMIRKYSNSDCYLRCMAALMNVGLSEKSRNYLNRALSSLPKKEHVTLISRFALMENQHGFPEQAQALFENVLTSYPNRVDVWSVYVDMLIKSGSIDLARQVLERAAGQQLQTKKMKSIYSKWLSFEETYGNDDLVQKVRDAALQYVNNVTSNLE